MTREELLELLRRAEPAAAAGLYTRREADVAVESVLFAYLRGGGWAILSSDQGVRISDAHSLWALTKGVSGPWVNVTRPPGHHSGELRDMLVPRWLQLWPELGSTRPQKYVVSEAVEDVEFDGRACHRAWMSSGPADPEIELTVDAHTGVVLRMAGAGSELRLGPVDLHADLADTLFTWV